MARVGSVAELRRFPVKSLIGELLTSADVDERGLTGDRRWAVTDEDGKLGSGKSTRRFRAMPGLLELSASYDPHLVPVIAFPDGRRVSAEDPGVHDVLSDHVGRPVRLLTEGPISHFDDGPLHLVTTASMDALAREHGAPVSTARMRSNLLVDVPAADGLVENGWIGRLLAIGPDLVVSIREPMLRCVMVDQPQIGLPPGGGILDTLGRLNGAALGVVAEVVSPGAVTVHDSVELVG